MNFHTIHDQLLEISPIGIVTLNVSGDITYANTEAEKILGLAKNELSQRDYKASSWNITDLHHQPFQLEMLPFRQVMNSAKSVFNVEHAIECPDGRRVYLSINAAPIMRDNQIEGVIATIQDISNRIILERKLQESETRYQHLFNNLLDEVHVWKVVRNQENEIASWELIDANAISLKNWGKTKEQVLGKNAIELFGQVSIELFLPIVRQIFVTHKPYRWEVYFPPTDQYLSMDSIPIGEDYFISTGKDITDKIKANEELRVAKEKAEESDQLKTSFLQNLSHEIRTPLNAIYGFSQILESKNIDETVRQNYISLIKSSSTQLLSIVSDVLMASSLEKGQETINVKSFNLNAALRELHALFREKADAKNLHLALHLGLSDELSEIETDETKLVQILTNLLNNALKFTQQGSIKFGYTIVSQTIQFYVSDTGIGISSSSHEVIFERFRQANSTIANQYGGNGLGLSISKDYAELLGGRIWIDSEPEKGATFYVTIPYFPKPKKRINQASHDSTILVVDDEIINFMVVQGMLMNLPVTLIHARDGQEAIDICQSNDQVDLVLMDIKMPVMTGDVAAKAIKLIRSNLPIIAQSGYDLELEEVKYKGVFNDYLKKPINETILVETISQHIEI